MAGWLSFLLSDLLLRLGHRRLEAISFPGVRCIEKGVVQQVQQIKKKGSVIFGIIWNNYSGFPNPKWDGNYGRIRMRNPALRPKRMFQGSNLQYHGARNPRMQVSKVPRVSGSQGSKIRGFQRSRNSRVQGSKHQGSRLVRVEVVSWTTKWREPCKATAKHNRGASTYVGFWLGEFQDSKFQGFLSLRVPSVQGFQGSKHQGSRLARVHGSRIPRVQEVRRFRR